MPLPERGQAPYAPGHTVLGFIDHVRDKGIPSKIDQEYIGLIPEIGESYARRVLRALEMLDLVDAESGQPTQTLRDIQQEAGAELPETLAEWFKKAYAEVLRFVSPDDDIQRITGQFQRYTPTGQKDRMVQLFLHLANAANLRPDVPKMPRGSTAKAKNDKPRREKQQKTNAPRADSSTPPPKAETTDSARERYLGLLMALAEKSDGPPDAELLDRIERVLGVPKQEVSP
jgi:hypothetical protein